MVSFFMCELSIRARPWPGTHEPPSASERAAQRFERSENALDVVAGVIETSLHPYHTVWFFFYMLELSIRAGPGLGRMSRLALQRVRRSGSSAVRTPLTLLPV